MNTPTPELDKQRVVIESGRTDTLTDFYDWLSEQGYELCQWVELDRYEPRLAPIHIRPEQLFADFFDIDLDLIETERRAILEELRAKQ